MSYNYQLLLSTACLLCAPSTGWAQVPSVMTTALSPARNAVAVPRTTPIVIPFSQPMQMASAGNVSVFSAQYRGKRTTTASVSGNTVTVVLTAPAGQAAAFRPGETVRVTVPASVLSTAGIGAVPYVYQFTVAASSGGGAFGASANLPAGALPFVAAGDVDSDGDIDIVSANGYNNGQAIIWLNGGAGGFAQTSTVSVGNAPVRVRLGDVDNDGDLDLLTASQSIAQVSIRFNNGNGNFTGTTEVAVSSHPDDLALGDVNGDGNLDLVAVCNPAGGINGGLLCVRLNNGSGAFTGTTNVPISVGIRRVVMADVDNDGDLDLLAAGGQQISAQLNDGNGNFSGTASLGLPNYPNNLAVADLDSDGDLDLLISNANVNSVSVRLNNGSGIFTGTTIVPVGTVPTSDINSLITGDVDGDGDQDFITTNYAREISVGLNSGNATFPTVRTTSAGGSRFVNEVLLSAK